MDEQNLIVSGFLAERASGIGGTDSGVIAGVSKHKTPLQLFYEKRNELPDLGAASARDFMQWGKALEPLIRRHYKTVTGRKVKGPAFLRHESLPFIIGHIDGRVWRKEGRFWRRGVLEIKTAFFTKRREWEESGVPDAYYLQCQHYLAITGDEFASVAVLFGGSAFEFFDIQRDERLIQLLLAAEVEFWERVKRNDPPSPTYDALGGALVAAMYPAAKIQDREVVLSSDEATARVEQLLRLRTARQRIEKRMEEIETWLKYQVQDAERAYVPGVARVKWAASSRRSVDYDQLQKEVTAEIFAKVVSESASRRLSVRDIRKDKTAEAVPEVTERAERKRRRIQVENL